MLSLEDPTMLSDFAKSEEEEPGPRKTIDESRTIYQSSRFRPPKGRSGYGLPILCDLGKQELVRHKRLGPSFNRTSTGLQRWYLKCRGEAPSIFGTWRAW